MLRNKLIATSWLRSEGNRKAVHIIRRSSDHILKYALQQNCGNFKEGEGLADILGDEWWKGHWMLSGLPYRLYEPKKLSFSSMRFSTYTLIFKYEKVPSLERIHLICWFAFRTVHWNGCNLRFLDISFMIIHFQNPFCKLSRMKARKYEKLCS